ncbi:MAG: AMP-binding protein, partial [Actinomycetes bacterium]
MYLGSGLSSHLRARAGVTAIVDERGSRCTYAELADRVESFAESLGPGRRLVEVRASNDVGSVVALLAAWTKGDVALVTSSSSASPQTSLYEPDTVVTGGERPVVDVRHEQPRHNLHPELSMLLSTSGSTGSPRLVRLSTQGVTANAAAIAAYLGLAQDDVALTSLPLHYCYGLSVLTSHLVAGATVVVRGGSLVDPCVRDACRQQGVTTLAAVPHTFRMLELSGLDRTWAPALRRVTQAGGRLAPEQVRRWAAQGRQDGWDLVVMYGQTEATARMAWLPPHLAAERPETVGIAVPGGRFTLDVTGDGDEVPADIAAATGVVGEIVYRGPNVMMGYATQPSDLAHGAEREHLHTGDLGRFGPDGLLEVVGRRSRFVKPLGVRVDLDELARKVAGELDDRALVHCTGDDDLVVVAVEVLHDPAGAETAARTATVQARELTGLPAGAVRGVGLPELPTLPSGKVDDQMLLRLVRAAEPADPPSCKGSTCGAEEVRRLFATVVGHTDLADDDSFASAGGDSLGYVEVAYALDDMICPPPHDWHLRSIAELGALVDSRRSAPEGTPAPTTRTMQTDVVLRAAAIAAVVAYHVRLTPILGGAHLLLAIAGYNFARFQLAPGVGPRQMWRSVGRFTLLAVAFGSGLLAVVSDTTLANVFLVNNYAGGGPSRYWFLEAFLQLLVVVTALASLPAARKLERRWPFGCAIAAVAVGLGARFALHDLLGSGAKAIFATHVVAWLFFLGWSAQRAHLAWQRVLVSVVALAATPSMFDQPHRGWIVAAGVVTLTWSPRIPVPQSLRRPLTAVAAASLWIYLTHWYVFPPVAARLGAAAAVLASLVVGIGISTSLNQIAAARTTRRGHTHHDRAPATHRNLPTDPAAAPTAQLLDRPSRTRFVRKSTAPPPTDGPGSAGTCTVHRRDLPNPADWRHDVALFEPT